MVLPEGNTSGEERERHFSMRHKDGDVPWRV